MFSNIQQFIKESGYQVFNKQQKKRITKKSAIIIIYKGRIACVINFILTCITDYQLKQFLVCHILIRFMFLVFQLFF